MPSEARSPRLAVLIDADNTSAKIADGLFEEIAKIGEASVRRIYGDFSSARSKGWADVLSKHAIIPQQQFSYTTGKNASDITLVIDTMDLLHSGRFDGFCLVSSDSDFTRLASRIREQGVDVFGFGEQKTPESFRQACRRFVYTENLLTGPTVTIQDAALTTKPLQPLSDATAILNKVIEQIESEDGWVPLGTVGKQLANIASDFDPRTFGFRKLSDLVRKTNSFEHRPPGRRHLAHSCKASHPKARQDPKQISHKRHPRLVDRPSARLAEAIRRKRSDSAEGQAWAKFSRRPEMRARHGAMTELDAGALARMRSSGVAEFRESSKFP
jgi:uncharacterized LabA/DUF88 family protein